MSDLMVREHRRLGIELTASVPTTPFINGAFSTQKKTRDRLPIYDPFTGALLTEMEAADASDIEQAVNSASVALEAGEWSSYGPRDRMRALQRIAELIDEHKEELALLEAIDTGKRLAGTKGWDIPNAAEVFRYYSGWCDKLLGAVFPGTGSHHGYSELEPAGVVAAIMPWNFPFACLAWKVAPALAAGCTIVVKSAERAPLSTHFFGRLLEQAKLPPGVINLIAGTGKTVGAALVEHALIRRVTFTGSVETARDIVRRSADNLPRLSLELGGKSPNVIMHDCNIEKAVRGTMSAIFDVAGQNCLAGSRTYVHSQIYDEFLARLKERVDAVVIGDNLLASTGQGPQIDADHLQRINGFVKRSLEQGGTILAGGGIHRLENNLYLPTLIECPSDEMEIVQDEVFGPVGSILRFEDFEEVLSRANANRYGLAAAIWTRSNSISRFFSKKIRAGTVWVNTYGFLDVTAPWGGSKLSGFGKELGQEALNEFLEYKVIFRNEDE